MTLKDILSTCSLETLGREMGLEIRFVEGQLVCKPLDPDDPRYSADFILPSMKMVEACRADDFDFFQPCITAGKLTVEQMHHAAERYYLGKTRSGRPVFWMIDDMMEPLDAHIGTDDWISTQLKVREPFLNYWHPKHCLFGLHLLGLADSADSAELADRADSHTHSLAGKPVCVVESEESAVVLSELFPESLWMAYVELSLLSPELFAPLQGHVVTIYPRTDYCGSTYLFFEDLAAELRRHCDIHICVASFLEDNATEEQKERGIDLLGFLFE